ncbi:MAG: thioredoxin-like domain-containing protein [Candidatus Krumholzibacteria bacterium]|nr:thioredoxin-like domain-containing protein [Candidatus Krumholzibacteria bacterium]
MRFRRTRIVSAIIALVVLAGGSAFAQTGSAQALKRINDDLRIKSQSMTPYEYIDFAEKAMLDFLKKYPKAPEAAQAHYSLGRIYASIGAYDNALRHFGDYIALPGDKRGPEAIAQARFIMGSCYMALERYDEAERSFKLAMNTEGAAGSRAASGAAAELSRIGTLRKLKIGGPAIPIAATSYQGRKIRFPQDYKGKVVLVDFWAAWCNPCRMEMPNVIRTYEELHKKGFEIIGVSLDNDREKFTGYLRENPKMEWPQLYDGKYWMSEYAQLYAVNSIPAAFLVDRKGIIRFKNVRGEALREAVMKLLDEK